LAPDAARRAESARHDEAVFPYTVLRLLLGEAIVLSAVGGCSGWRSASHSRRWCAWFLPALPVHTPLIFVVLAEALALVIGPAAGVLPARRASLLDPVEALRAE
jgi:putative ABC transport system permease protein